jgi:hypothetical protein
LVTFDALPFLSVTNLVCPKALSAKFWCMPEDYMATSKKNFSKDVPLFYDEKEISDVFITTSPLRKQGAPLAG